jgi:hypothetical protein
MLFRHAILSILLLLTIAPKNGIARGYVKFDYYGDTLQFNLAHFENIHFDSKSVTEEAISQFYAEANSTLYRPIINHLIYYKQAKQLDDWFFYQLVRKTAQQICPKQENFELYTLYKWFATINYSSTYEARIIYTTFLSIKKKVNSTYASTTTTMGAI